MDFPTFLTALRGAPLAVFLALGWYRGNNDLTLTEGFISSVVGYSEKTVRGALELLIRQGLAYRHGRFSGYDLTDYAVVLVSTITATIEGSNDLMSTAEVIKRESTGQSVKFTGRVDHRKPEYIYLAEVGIGEPTRSRMVALEWASLDYFKAHLEKGLNDGDSLGLIIHRIMNHDPIKKNSRQHSQDPERYKTAWIRNK